MKLQGLAKLRNLSNSNVECAQSEYGTHGSGVGHEQRAKVVVMVMSAHSFHACPHTRYTLPLRLPLHSAQTGQSAPHSLNATTFESAFWIFYLQIHSYIKMQISD